jgi:hypothetical protein
LKTSCISAEIGFDGGLHRSMFSSRERDM